MKKRKLVLILLPLLLIGFAAVLFKLNAQNPTPGLTISPSNFELTLKPGETIEKTINLYNGSKNEVDIATLARNFGAQGEEGNIILTSSETGFSLASWIKITPEKGKIGSSKSGKFTVTITVPDNAEPGGHFGSVVLSTIPPSKEKLKETGAFLVQEVASLFLVRIPGDVKEEASLLSFSTNQPFYNSSVPVQLSARVKNNSNVHIKPIGVIEITDMFGKREVVQVEERNILPGAIRKIPAVFSKNILIGKYTATANLFYGTSNKTLTATTTFYAFPVKLGLIVLAVIIFLFLFRKRVFKALRVIVIGK